VRTVRIDRRYRGPNSSGNGGYATGLVGREFEGPAEVQLRLPPPLDRNLELRPDGDAIGAWDGDAMVALGRPAELALDVPNPPSLDIARAAAKPFEPHPFPECFVCGPHRSADDGLRIFPGPIDGDAEFFATPWTPHPSLPNKEGVLAPEIVWGALDCPTSCATRPGHPAVVASLTVDIRRPVSVGETVTVSAWPLEVDGRKRWGAAALHSAEGELLACSKGLWVELKDPTAFESAV